MPDRLPPRTGSDRARIVVVLAALDVYGSTSVVARYAIALTRAGHDVCVIYDRSPRQAGGGGVANDLERAGVETHRAPGLARLRPSALRSAAGAASGDGDGPAIVLAAQAGAVTPAHALSRRLGRPLVIFAQNPPRFAGRLRAVKRSVYRHSARRARRVVCVAPHIARELVEVERLAPERVDVVCNGIDPGPEPDRSAASTAGVRRSLGVAESSRLIVNVARLNPQKAQHDLVGAARRLAADPAAPEFSVVIVGDANSATDRRVREGLTQSIAAAGLGDRVRLVGYRTDVRAILEASDVFTLPSKWEGFSLAALEAMAAACPAVLSDQAVPAPAFTAPDHGYIVPAGDPEALAEALLTLLNTPDERLDEMGRRAREAVVERCSLDRAAAEFVSVIERTLLPSGADGPPGRDPPS